MEKINQENTIEITKMREQVLMLGEMMKRLDKQIEEGFKNLENKMDKYVLKAVYKLDMQQVKENQKKASNRWDWVIKTVMGIVITVLIMDKLSQVV